MDYEFIKSTFPDFKYEFTIDNESVSKEDSCKHWSFDFFGSKVCVDRYIESGEYSVIDTFDEFSILERVNKKVSLTNNELDLIQKSIINWEKEVSVKCIFPSIKNKTISYIDNDVGRFYLKDVFGIPFEWKSKNDNKYYRDTLPGIFKHHSILSFQNFENIQKLDSIENLFEILYEPKEFE